MLHADIREATALLGGGDPEETLRAVEVFLCEIVQVDRLFRRIGVHFESGPGRAALRIPALGPPAVFEAEDFARALQGEPAFADKEQ